MVFQIPLVFKDFKKIAEKYNIEKAITSQHFYARCQEWSHLNKKNHKYFENAKEVAKKSLV